MLNATKKIARACQSGLTSSLDRIIGYLDGGQTGRHLAPPVSPGKDDQRSCQPAGEQSLEPNSSHPHLSLTYEDAARSAKLEMEKLSPCVIKDLHEAMDDLASNPLADSTD